MQLSDSADEDKLCGQIQKGTKFASDDNKVYVKFVTDGSVNFPAWKLKWKGNMTLGRGETFKWMYVF